MSIGMEHWTIGEWDCGFERSPATDHDFSRTSFSGKTSRHFIFSRAYAQV